jgi:hypothetical protein
MADETITLADVERIIAERLAAEDQKRADEQTHAAEEAQRIADAVAVERAKWEQDTAANRRLPMDVPTWRSTATCGATTTWTKANCR